MSELVLARVAIGRYVLVLGDPAGTAIVPAASQGEPRSRPLAKAIAQTHRQHGSPPTGAAPPASAMESASQVTGKIERAVSLFTEIAQGRLDPASAGDEVDALLGLLRRLDHDERWDEALSVAHSLAMLLALLGRWVELLQSLQVALSAAEQAGDAGGKAWALHELGTVHLAAEKHAEADRLLNQAHDLREQPGHRQELATTDRNLQILCRALRAQLHEPPLRRVLDQILRRPAPALLLAMLLLVLGGAAGAVIRGSGNARDSTTVRRNAAGEATETTTTEATKTTTTNGKPGSAPRITSAKGTTFDEETENSFTVTATGTPSPTLTETGTLPNGVTFNDGVLSGTPTATGGFPITFTATNRSGSSVQGFTLTVSSKPAITSANNTTFSEGTAGSFTVAATGSPTPTITEDGALPEGVKFSDGVLAGTPAQRGVYPITFSAANGAGSGAVQSFTLTVAGSE